MYSPAVPSPPRLIARTNVLAFLDWTELTGFMSYVGVAVTASEDDREVVFVDAEQPPIRTERTTRPVTHSKLLVCKIPPTTNEFS